MITVKDGMTDHNDTQSFLTSTKVVIKLFHCTCILTNSDAKSDFSLNICKYKILVNQLDRFIFDRSVVAGSTVVKQLYVFCARSE